MAYPPYSEQRRRPARRNYDIRSERCALASENHIHVYSSLEELLADNTVDIVVIATPNDLHKPQTIAALSAGKHVICEKPVTVSSADLKDMIDASTKYQRLFTVHQNRRWDCDYLMIKQVYAEGLLGEVTSIESRIHGSRGIPATGEDNASTAAECCLTGSPPYRPDARHCLTGGLSACTAA